MSSLLEAVVILIIDIWQLVSDHEKVILASGCDPNNRQLA